MLAKRLQVFVQLAASFFYSYLVVQLFVGVLIDKYGMKLMIPAAIFLGALGAALFAFSNTVWFADLDRALMGIAAAFATVCYLKNVAVWFPPEKFAFLAGLITLSVMFGAIFGEAPLAVVIHYEGWRNAVLVCSILGLFIGFAFFLFITDKHPQTTNQHRIKSEVNLKNIKAIFKSKQNWFVMLYSGLAFAPLAVFGGLWGNPFLMSAYHFSIIQAAKLISIAFIGFALGGPLLGFLSDHYRKRIPLMLAGVALSLVTILLTIYANHISYSMLAVLLFLFGFGTSAFMLGFAVAKESNPIFLAAVVVSIINSGDAFFLAQCQNRWLENFLI